MNKQNKQKDNEAVHQLLKKQKEECFNILNELITNSKKTSHWAWYVFPTEKEGDNDPLQTYVTIDTAKILLEFAPYEWRLCLEKIIDLAIDKNNKLNEVLFDIDINRVGYFVDFWKIIPNKQVWLINVCEDLENILNGITPIWRIRTNINTEYLVLLIQKHFDKLNNL
jgi:hypothetical protein